MKKNYLASFFGIVLIIINSQLLSQIFDPQIIPDSVLMKNIVPCGLSPDYLKKLDVGNTAYNPKTLPNSFPANAILICGKFEIYYEDLILSNPQVGFADAAVGTARRNTLCAVLTYVQTVFDFSNIPAGNPIKLHVNESYAPIFNPAPAGEQFLAKAGPTYTNLGSAQIINGFVHDYVTTGIDPAGLNQYHAELTVNFDQIANWVGLIQWQNDYTLPISNCHYDLYSVLLHEIGHTLGWFSLIQHTDPVAGIGPPVSVIGNNQYSGIDASLHYGANSYPLVLEPLIVGAPSSPSINPTYLNNTMFLLENKIWINDQASPHNDPVYSGIMTTGTGSSVSVKSLLSHLDDQMRCYSTRSRISPGDSKNYVMAPFSAKGILRRTFTDIEINTLLDLNYSINSGFSNLTLTNSPPYSMRMASYNNYLNNVFPEIVPADFTIMNNIGVSQVIVLSESADATLDDAENDPLYVAQGSLVNYRGCGIGGNNHNALTITTTASGDIITYVPRPNFYGRAQFGFRLWDGKEEGSYVIYTIDVEKGNNVNCISGENIVLNGDFEEGSEVKRLGSEELIDASVSEQSKLREGKLRAGIHFGDCHPFNYLANNYYPYGAGDLIKVSDVNCNGTIYKSPFGSYNVSFPSIGGSNPNPDAINGLGQRYRKLSGSFNYFNLCSEVEICKKYFLEFDYFAKPGNISTGTIMPLTIAFTNTATFPSLPTYTYNTTHDITVINNSWQHVSIPFAYCGSTPANILSLVQSVTGEGFLIDNIELKENLTPLPLTINIDPSSPIICSGQSVSLNATVDNALCDITYNWLPAIGISCTDCPNPIANPNISTDYTLTVNDGCSLTSEQISIIVDNSLNLSITASDANLCPGESSILEANGAVNYTWNPGNLNSNLITVSPVTNTTYTVTGTGTLGCTSAENISITVDNSLVDITASQTTICQGETSILTALGADSYTWEPATGLSSTTGDVVTANPLTTTTYTLTGTSIDGCISSAVITINVDNSLNLSITASNINLCPGESSTLEAAGAVNFTWNPGNLNANPITVSPLTNTMYSVTGTSALGCTVTENISIIVDNSLTDFTVTASQNAICPGASSILSAMGADSYTWTPATGLSSTTGGIVTANPAVTTTYTVTGTSIGGCTGTSDITITVDNSLNLSITASDINICPGESSTLEAVGAVNYTWNPGNSNTNPISVSPLTNTIYTVTGTSVFGCTASENISINVDNSLANLSVNASQEDICPGGYSILSASGAETYSWEPGNFYGNPYTVFPNITTVYSVTGTSLEGCIATTEINITVTENENPLCCLPSNLTINDDENSLNVGTVPNGSIIDINGVFTVNSNFALVACTLRMAPNARIEVMSGFNFNLANCLIYSCTEMWDGIYSNPGAMLTINGSRIEDATYAVYSVYGGNYFLNNNIFNKNNISLYVGQYNGTHPGIVKNCTFDCTNINSPTLGSSLISPMTGQKSHFGIYGHSIDQITFGEVSAQPNVFQNIEIGIGLKGTKANIYRNNFNNIVEPFCAPVFPSNCPVIGWAIWAGRCHLLIGDNAGMSHENNISDCSNGIFLDGYCSFEIRKNNFTNILTPTFKGQYSKCIFARFGELTSSPSYGEIEDNTFTNFEAGVYYEANQMNYFIVERNTFAGFNTPNGTAIYLRQNRPHQIGIRNNVINNTPPFKGWYGIRVQNAVQSSNNVTIEKNTIKNVRHAIWTTNYDGLNISNQSADFTSIGANAAGIYYPNTLPTALSVGIKVENCPNTTIANNLIQKAMPNPTVGYTNLLYGISVETNGIGSTIIENEVKRLGKGLNFYGQPNAPLYVSCNAMYLNRTGLSLNNTYIGNQGAPNPSGVAQDNQWTIPGNEVNYWLGVELLGSSSSSSIWYSRMNTMPFFPNLATQMNPDNSITPNIISGTPYNCSFGCANPPCLMVDGGKMIKKENPFNLLNNEEKQMIDIQMYKLLKNSPSYLTSGTPDDSIYVSYVDSLNNTNIGKIYRFSKQLELGDTTASYNEILSVNPIFTAETNHKIVNEIYWRSWVHNIFEFSPADSSYLLFVAEQHPHQGGTAVYDARTMLGLDFYDYGNEDQQKSTTIEEEEINALDYYGEIKFVLFPNPANSYINYRASLSDNENAELIMYDLMGKPICSQIITTDNLEGIIDIEGMSSGMYTYGLFINKDPIEYGTFIIN